MRRKPIQLRQAAERDITLAVAWYAANANRDVANRYIDALQEAYLVIASNPKIGSQRYATTHEIPELRSLTLRKFPFHIFHIEQDDRIEIWRVLNSSRDIPNVF